MIFLRTMKLTSGYVFLLAFFTLGRLSAQYDPAPIQSNRLIDAPTCAFLPRAWYRLGFKFFAGGGLALAGDFGINERLNVGLGWGMDHLIDQGEMDYFIPGVSIRYLVLPESYLLPAVSLGFDNRPLSTFESGVSSRHYFKSRGFYLAASKNYFFLGSPIGFHGGLNYSIVDNKRESYDYLPPGDGLRGKNDFLNAYMGLDKTFFDRLAILLEYDCAMDDNLTHNPFLGLMNFGIRYDVLSNFSIELDFKDLFGNKRPLTDSGYGRYGNISRELQLIYRQHF